jgi:Domain of unknown function(DUF2779)
MSTTKPRYLSKSRFKLGMECPAKLFYTGKKKEYADQKLDDPFLAALADGGFQVGELAKAYFPGGHNIETLDYDDALGQTNKLLQQENVIIFEAAIRFDNLFIRADILVKKGARLDLIEVKAKSYDAAEDGDFLTNNKKGPKRINSKWKPYLLDVAFQKYVVSSAFPNFKVTASLMLADKAAFCPTEGLHQKFRVVKDDTGRKKAEATASLNEAEQNQKILCQIEVDAICRKIYDDILVTTGGPTTFVDRIKWLASHYERNEKIVCKPSAACADCEFQTTPEEDAKGLKNGLKECWKHTLKWTDEDFDIPNLLDIWDYRKKSKGELIAGGRFAMSDVAEDDIEPKPDGEPGLSHSERQWLQVQKVKNNDNSISVEKPALKREIQRWKFPLHFIDFETSRVAIPFNKGRHPYELVAFQFSHHILYQDGRLEHKGQYLNPRRGVFPNYDFVRALKKELEGDDGSIFRYATHENSTLVEISRQLAEDPNPPEDRAALRQFIRSITTSTKDSTEQWDGARTMIDLRKMVLRYYYDPVTNGANSIKVVLPAILNNSDFLKKKYAQPIYGGKGGIPSLNFKDMVWIKMDGNKVIDPYKQLPKMFADISDRDFERISSSEDDELNNGGAAMTAYAHLQYEEMSEKEREEISVALLRYCELDTLAMVMIYEAWANLP